MNRESSYLDNVRRLNLPTAIAMCRAFGPHCPGLGVELIKEARADFPDQEIDLPLLDGSMNTKGIATGTATFDKRKQSTRKPMIDSGRPLPT
jgi:hypothetical protein